MMKFGMSGIAALALMAAPAAAQDRVVNVYNWSDYIDSEVLAAFEEETGIKVNYDVFDSNEVLETKLLTGGSGYDVVVPSASFLARQIQAGVYQPLDQAKLPNMANMREDIRKKTAVYDPDNAYSVNYMWGTSGLGVNADKITELMPDAPLDSWSLLFDATVLEKIHSCGVHVMDEPDEMIPAALHYLGLNPDSSDPAEIEQAGELLKSIRPYIQKFHNSEFVNALANGDICLAYGWSGDVFQASDRAAEAGNGVEVSYVLPEEGAQMWFDQLAIPADAPHTEEALTFLNFLMRPDVAARLTDYVYYANGNEASVPLINPEITGNPAIYPTAEVMEKLYTVTAKPPRVQRTITRMWTNVKTGN